MKKLILNQLRLYRSGFANARRLLHASLRVMLADLREHRTRKKINKKLIHHLLESPQIVAALEGTTFPEEPVRITFAGAVRCVGNPNHHLERFLRTVLHHAKDINRVEVLLAIDADDDIEHFLALKNKYGSKLRLRIFISPVQFAYERLHMYDTVLLPHMARGSRMMGRCSDDCVVTLQDFDEELLEIDKEYPDNIYFVQTRTTNRERFLGDVSKEMHRLFWVFHTMNGCHSYFPIISKGVLQGAEKALQFLPENVRATWSPYGNGAIVDCYVDILANYTKAQGLDRIHELNMVDLKHGIFVYYQHKRDSFGLTANDRFFIKMLGQDTQSHLKRIASILVESAQPRLKAGKREITVGREPIAKLVND